VTTSGHYSGFRLPNNKEQRRLPSPLAFTRSLRLLTTVFAVSRSLRSLTTASLLTTPFPPTFLSFVLSHFLSLIFSVSPSAMTTPSTPLPTDSNDVKSPLSPSTLEEENRDLRRKMELMEAMMQKLLTPAVNPTSMEPLSAPRSSRSSPATVRVPPAQRPPLSVARSLQFRQPPLAPVATTSAAAPIDDHPSSAPPKSRSVIRVSPPQKFSGTARERSRADTWLGSVNDWLALTAEGLDDDKLIMTFGTVLDGSAQTWLRNLRNRADARNETLTLQDVFDIFMATYAGGMSQKMAEQRLNALVYGKGECKDLNALDSEFDRLTQELYPGAEESQAAIALLGGKYGEIIRKGDVVLWKEAMRSRPSTVEEWKAAVQDAYIIIETTKAHESRPPTERHEVRSTFYSKSSPSPSTSTYRSESVQVKEMEDEETKGESDEELQKAEVRSTPRAGSQPSKERLGTHLTFKQRSRLSELNKCWVCLEKGHRSFECEKKGKPGYPRKPTEADLKA
jgi:hypothetical protein